MLFGTCTVRRDAQLATFGWSNHASRDKFIRHIERRLADGQRYWVVKAPSVSLLFNQAMVYDKGVSPAHLRMVKEEVGELLRTGDVSVLQLQSPLSVVRLAVGCLDILYQHTICQSAKELELSPNEII